MSTQESKEKYTTKDRLININKTDTWFCLFMPMALSKLLDSHAYCTSQSTRLRNHIYFFHSLFFQFILNTEASKAN